MLRKGLAALEAAGGKDDLESAVLLNNLSRVRLQSGHSLGTEEHLNTAMKIMEQKAGPQHPLLIGPLMNLAFVECVREYLTAAERLMIRPWAISERALGPDHFKTGEILKDYLCGVYGRSARSLQSGPRSSPSLRKVRRRHSTLRAKGEFASFDKFITSFGEVLN